MPAIILADSGWTGSLEMSSFQGLSGGKTCKAARILSASGVLNITGLVICGICGWSPPAGTSAAHNTTGVNQFMAGVLRRIEGIGTAVEARETVVKTGWRSTGPPGRFRKTGLRAFSLVLAGADVGAHHVRP